LSSAIAEPYPPRLPANHPTEARPEMTALFNDDLSGKARKR